jgi:3,4-dihydroxy 2-butanone 4-phosphate synthase/GTP cyclohydrolase II
MRDIGIGVQVLRALGLSELRLLTNRVTDLPNLDAFGLRVVERVPIVCV